MSIKRLYQMVREIMKDMNEAYVSVFSAQAAFFLILSFFPFIMFLLTLIQYIPLREDILSRFYDIIPNGISSTLSLIVKELYLNTTTTVTSVTAITTLWSASKGFLGLVRGLNSVYHIKETRNYIKLRLISAVYTLVFTVLLIITLIFLVFGNQIYDLFFKYFPELADLALFVISIRAVVTLILLTLFFLLMFVFIPNRKTKILRELPGALIAAAGWLIFSFGYSFYIDHMAGFSSTYGSLTAMVLLMLWVYFCMYILFVGAELNVYMQNNGILIKKEK